MASQTYFPIFGVIGYWLREFLDLIVAFQSRYSWFCVLIDISWYICNNMGRGYAYLFCQMRQSFHSRWIDECGRRDWDPGSARGDAICRPSANPCMGRSSEDWTDIVPSIQRVTGPTLASVGPMSLANIKSGARLIKAKLGRQYWTNILAAFAPILGQYIMLT